MTNLRQHSWIERIRRKLFPVPLTPKQIELQRLLEICNQLKSEEETRVLMKDYPHIDFFYGAREEINRLSRNHISIYRVYGDDEAKVRLRCSWTN